MRAGLEQIPLPYLKGRALCHVPGCVHVHAKHHLAFHHDQCQRVWNAMLFVGLRVVLSLAYARSAAALSRAHTLQHPCNVTKVPYSTECLHYARRFLGAPLWLWWRDRSRSDFTTVLNVGKIRHGPLRIPERFHLLDYFHALCYGAKDHMLAVQPVCWSNLFPTTSPAQPTTSVFTQHAETHQHAP
jgi:hypothetical protein